MNSNILDFVILNDKRDLARNNYLSVSENISKFHKMTEVFFNQYDKIISILEIQKEKLIKGVQ
jgi:hypothetical protein